MNTYLAAASLFGLAVFAAAPALAQTPPAPPPILFQPDPDSPLGTRNPDGPEQLSEFDFVIGDWDVTITLRLQNGQEVTYGARWHNHWILDGMAVMQEWRGPYATGAEFRTFNVRAGHWEGYNLYPGGQGGWSATTAAMSDGEMIITIPGVDAEGQRLSREVYTDITPDSFRMYAEISRDEGVSWTPGDYQTTAVRAGE